MLSVWWSCAGVIHYIFLPSGATVTIDHYCQELQILMKLAVKYPRLMNCTSWTEWWTLATLRELKLETMSHSLFSPDLAPTDFCFFGVWITLCKLKTIPKRQWRSVKIKEKWEHAVGTRGYVPYFVDSCADNCYRNDIHKLSIKWQEYVNSLCKYSDICYLLK